MAFSDFTFPQVQQDLGLMLDETDLFSAIPAVPLREDFVNTITEGATVALAVNTEKAQSEFIIAPVLLEVRRQCGGAVGLFSGVALDVGGCAAYCDQYGAKKAWRLWQDIFQETRRHPIPTIYQPAGRAIGPLYSRSSPRPGPRSFCLTPWYNAVSSSLP